MLPSMVLAKVWKLAEVDPNGLLDNEEFVLDNHITKARLKGHEVPTLLPPRRPAFCVAVIPSLLVHPRRRGWPSFQAGGTSLGAVSLRRVSRKQVQNQDRCPVKGSCPGVVVL